MADENKKTPGPSAGLSEQQDRKKQDRKKQGPMGGLGNLPRKKKKEPEVIIMQMVDGRQHPDSIKLKKMKKIENDKGNIDFVDLKAKGGRAGYKYGGAAIRGVSKILR